MISNVQGTDVPLNGWYNINILAMKWDYGLAEQQIQPAEDTPFILSNLPFQLQSMGTTIQRNGDKKNLH